jgi:hypothetical protein
MDGINPSESLKVRFRIELSSGIDEQIAKYELARELPDVLGDRASPEGERIILDVLDREILAGCRALVRARLARDQADDPSYLFRVRAPLELPNGVDEALASWRACLRSRSG